MSKENKLIYFESDDFDEVIDELKTMICGDDSKVGEATIKWDTDGFSVKITKGVDDE